MEGAHALENVKCPCRQMMDALIMVYRNACACRLFCFVARSFQALARVVHGLKEERARTRRGVVALVLGWFSALFGHIFCWVRFRSIGG